MIRLGHIVNKFLERINLKLSFNDFPRKFDKDFGEIFEKCKKFTMTSEERMYSLYNAVKYIVDADIKGDIVECGVWKGGSMMIAASTLVKMKEKKRNLYLYDTFAGMSAPTKHDLTNFNKNETNKKWNKMQKDDYNEWCYSPLNEVKNNMEKTGYPKNKIKYVKGKVEDTIPKTLPKKISLLRLDTDWFESTYHEMKYLFPLLAKNGVLIIDDYGHWQGSKKAVDKYLKEKKIKILLNSIDYSGRIGIKI